MKETVQTSVPAGTLMRLVRYTFAYKRLLLTAFILLLFSTGADVLGPMLVKIFIDDYLMPQNWQAVEIGTLVLIYATANIAAALLGYWQTVRLSDIAQKVVLKIRQDIFGHILDLPIRRFDFTPVGSVVSRITNDTETIKELFVGVLGVYLQNIIKIFGIFVAMAILNVKLMLICALFVPLVILLMMIYRRFSTPVFSRARSLLSEINGTLNETLQGIKVVQLFNQERRFAKSFERLNHQYFKTRTKTMQLDALLLRPMVDLLQLFTLAGLLYGFGVSSLESPVEIGVLYAFVNYLGRFIEPLIEMTQRLSLFQQAIVSAARVFHWLDEVPEVKPGSLSATIESSDLSLQEVGFSYEPNKPVIKKLSVDIPEGVFVGVVGHTGSGKSTLASLLMAFYQPETGQIKLGGKPLSSYSLETFRNQVAIVQQDSFIFRGSIRENIDISRNLTEASIWSALDDVGLKAFVKELPNGLDHLLTEKGQNLSFGQRQMISLARALAGNPSLLILDEATANVDSETEQIVQSALMRHKGNLTIIAIAHRLSTIVQADLILVMHQGELIQQGAHQSLLSEDGLYRHMFELQNLSTKAGLA